MSEGQVLSRSEKRRLSVAKKEEKKRRQEHAQKTRRVFLKVAVGAGLVGGAAYFAKELWAWLGDQSLAKDIQTKAKVPDYSLDSETAARLDPFFDKFQISVPDNYSTLPEVQRKDIIHPQLERAFNDSLALMRDSGYQPFVETAERIINGVEDGKAGREWGIRLAMAFYDGKVGEVGIFATHFDKDTNGFYFVLNANRGTFDPTKEANIKDPYFLTPMSVALSLVHEVEGHVNLLQIMTNELRTRKYSDDEILVRVDTFPFHEEYSYAVQASATSATLKARPDLRQGMSATFPLVSDEYDRVRSLGLDWTSNEWHQVVSGYINSPSANVDFGRLRKFAAGNGGVDNNQALNLDVRNLV